LIPDLAAPLKLRRSILACISSTSRPVRSRC
jgi:hypothetical protein